MIVRELISDILPSVKSTDSAARALDWMGEFKLNSLPIVDHGQYKGLVSENDILDATDLNQNVGEIRYSGWDGAFIHHGNHIYDAIEMMVNYRLEVLPVLDEENVYMGVITLRDMIQVLGRLFAVSEPGGILVLEIPANSYVLSEIGRIVESADAKVLSLYLSSAQPGEPAMLLTLKLNVEDLSRVVASFERFKYKVVRIYHKAAPRDDLRRNLDALMKYLDM
ncbi:MAG: CBS domain-containing protein [Bacteroidota bacterium]